MDQNYRLVFLFQEVSCSGFISEFNKRQSRMLQFLTELEEVAVQLDKINKEAKISSVAGSSVGAVGGVLSTAGLALIPVTAGVSLGLIIGGTVLGVSNGVYRMFSTVTEMRGNHAQQLKANGVFQSFMEDVQSLQCCLEEVSSQPLTRIEASKIGVAMGVGRVLNKVRTVANGIDALVDAASAAQVLESEELIAIVGGVLVPECKALRDVPKVASDIPDIVQAAKSPLSLCEAGVVRLMRLNALFLGMDVFFICKDSYSLAKGSQDYFSQFIRARAALWSSEMDSWKKIHDSLWRGLLTSEKQDALLDKQFYPRRQIKKLQCEITNRERDPPVHRATVTLGLTTHENNTVHRHVSKNKHATFTLHYSTLSK